MAEVMRAISSWMWPASLKTGRTIVTYGGDSTTSRSGAGARRRNVTGASEELIYARIRPAVRALSLRDRLVDRSGDDQRLETARADHSRGRTEDIPTTVRPAVRRRGDEGRAVETARDRHVAGGPPLRATTSAAHVPGAVAN